MQFPNCLPAQPIPIAATTEAETDAITLLDAAGRLVDSINTTLETTDGTARNEVAKGLAAILQAVAKRIEG
jgi:hypothetical protein